MKRAVVLATLLASGGAAAQMECRTDPRDSDLAFAVGPRGDTLEFRGRNAARQLDRVCVLTLDCTLREPPVLLDYFMRPVRAGESSSVWSIRSIRATYPDKTTQDCIVSATSEPRPRFEEPPPFIPRKRAN